jgi:hypothetical protein
MMKKTVLGFGLQAAVLITGCGGSAQTSGSVCTTGADCAATLPERGSLKDTWCVAASSVVSTGTCERVACENVGGWCGTGGRCVAPDAIDMAVQPARAGHCEKTACIDVLCPLLLMCSRAHLCERGVISPEELMLSQVR